MKDLYYIVGTNKLSGARERISGYVSSLELAEKLKEVHAAVRPSMRVYMRLAIRKCNAEKIMKRNK